MKKFFTRHNLLAVLLLCAFCPLFAQDKDEAKYREESNKIRKEVWGWAKPEFKNRQIPTEYATRSKVVIAHHTELSAESSSKFSLVGRQSAITEIVREMVKLNDKAAVDEYSEFNFTRFVKRSGFEKVKATTFIGVRVIKPDQSIKEINADDIVLTKDEATVKAAKLAIPDLQPGDIIDYFVATSQAITNDYKDKLYNVFLFDEAPVMHYSFHGELGKKFAIDYRSYNGAPQLKISKNEDDDIIIDVEKKNMPAFETTLWVAPALQLPLIRMNISRGFKGAVAKYYHLSKQGEAVENKNSDEVVRAQTQKFSADYSAGYGLQPRNNEFTRIGDYAKKAAKDLGLSFKDMSDEDKAAMLYYSFRFTKMMTFYIENLQRLIHIGDYSYDGLALVLNLTLKGGGLEPAILISSPRTGYRMSEVMDEDDLVTTAYVMGTNKLLSIESIYDVPFVAPESIDGSKITSSVKVARQSDPGPGMKIPESVAARNGHIEQLIMSVNPDKNNLAVQRKSIIKGHYKPDLQRQLILYEDLYEAERKALGLEMSLIEELEDSKKSKKFVDEVKNAFAEARKANKDAFISEAKDWFEQDITDMKNFKVNNLGVRHTAPDFIYSSSFNLEGLVKKAGNNLLIEIGKIQGTPLSIKPEQRKRTMDIYQPFARGIEYQIELKIPDGYTAEGVAALNKNVSNETGFFIVEASLTGTVVHIKVTKQYAHNFEPAANWDKMVQFIDASNEWAGVKLLLKKK